MSDPTIQEALDLGATFLRKANSAWACGEPPHRVRDMLDAADAFQKALDALSTPTTPDEGEADEPVRIAAWNAAKKAGASDDLAIAVVQAVAAEYAAIRALSDSIPDTKESR